MLEVKGTGLEVSSCHFLLLSMLHHSGLPVSQKVKSLLTNDALFGTFLPSSLAHTQYHFFENLFYAHPNLGWASALHCHSP